MTTPTPVTDPLTDAWKVLNDTKGEITTLTMKEIAEAVRVAVPDAVSLRLDYVEGPTWEITSPTVEGKGAYDLAEAAQAPGGNGDSQTFYALEDEVNDLTPFFWSVEPYSMVGFVSELWVDKHTGDLDYAVLDIEVMLGNKALLPEPETTRRRF